MKHQDALTYPSSVRHFPPDFRYDLLRDYIETWSPVHVLLIYWQICTALCTFCTWKGGQGTKWSAANCPDEKPKMTEQEKNTREDNSVRPFLVGILFSLHRLRFFCHGTFYASYHIIIILRFMGTAQIIKSWACNAEMACSIPDIMESCTSFWSSHELLLSLLTSWSLLSLHNVACCTTSTINAKRLTFPETILLQLLKFRTMLMLPQE